jgi:glycosyltransferase involved in cell wall biosynthesis
VNQSFSVVIPVHNEAEILQESVRDLLGRLDRWGGEYEVLLCENGSEDGTRDMAAALQRSYPQLRVMSLAEADYGRAMREGIREAQKDIVVIFDMDYYQPEFLDVCENLLAKSDIVIASKLLSGAQDRRPARRRMISMGFSLFLRCVFGVRVRETHGIKGFRREWAANFVEQCQFTRDIFDTELVIRAERAGFRICEVPTTVIERRPSRSSIAKRIPRTVADLLRLRWQLAREAAHKAATQR